MTFNDSLLFRTGRIAGLCLSSLRRCRINSFSATLPTATKYGLMKFVNKELGIIRIDERD